MRTTGAWSSRLAWKLFLSYLIIVLVGMAVLAGTAELLMPVALAPHIARMQSIVGESALGHDLYHIFSTAINEILLASAAAAAAAAVAVSLFVARRIVGPIRALTESSQRIAAGDYDQRVHLAASPVATISDELTELAGAFNQMAEALERTEHRRMELIGDVAHELRTPLTSVRSMTEGLADGVLNADSGTFQGIAEELSRLQRLVDDLEELSRAEAGQISLELQPIAPLELLQAIERRLAPQFDDKGVTLNIAASSPPGLRVLADYTRTLQIITNLTGNALQYTPQGGEVTIGAAAAQDMLLFSVRDNGIGIAATQLPHVFERFYRVDKSRSRIGGGSGIGLTVAKHVVEAQGGRIWAESRGQGHGATIRFTLPAAKP